MDFDEVPWEKGQNFISVTSEGIINPLTETVNPGQTIGSHCPQGKTSTVTTISAVCKKQIKIIQNQNQKMKVNQ